MRRLAPGEQAPDFDLTSTEDAVLMLRDEIPRSPALLYFFADPAGERARGDLAAIAARREDFARAGVKVMGISPAKLDDLKALQRELGLPFPLLTDDRGFSRSYGVEAGEGESPEPALVLVDRSQEVLWVGNPAPPFEQTAGEVFDRVKSRRSSTANYPRSVINRLVDRWVTLRPRRREERPA